VQPENAFQLAIALASKAGFGMPQNHGVRVPKARVPECFLWHFETLSLCRRSSCISAGGADGGEIKMILPMFEGHLGCGLPMRQTFATLRRSVKRTLSRQIAKAATIAP
jgi:hypothetical protein